MQRKMGCLSAIFIICTTVTTGLYAVGTGFFLGFQLGQTNLNNVSVPDPVTNHLVKPNNIGTGARFDLGYNFNPYFAWEGGAARYAPSHYSFSNGQCKGTPKYVFDLAAKGMFPVSVVSVFAKAGFAILRTSGLKDLFSKNSTSGTGCDGQQAYSTSARPLVAAGVSYDINQSWVVDLSWSRILKGGSTQSADFKALGISYHFTTKYCGQFIC